MGIFGGMSQAKVLKRRRFDYPGTQIVEIERVVHAKSNRPGKQHVERFAIEKRALLVLSTGTCSQAGQTEVRPGDRIVHMFLSDKEAFAGNVRGFLESMYGMLLGADFQPNSMSDKDWEELALETTGENQPLAGTFVVQQAQEIILQSTGNPFTVVDYTGLVTATKLREMLQKVGPDEESRLFPDGELQKRIDEEQAAAA